MLVGYSLEVALKGMLLLRRGVDEYTESEKALEHHKLVRLAEFIPNGRETDPERVFSLSEQHQIDGRDLFDVSTRVMGYLRTMVEEEAR